MLKWDAERDAEEYTRQCEREHRGSLSFRNVERLRQLQEENIMKTKELHTEHETYELKWEAEGDAEEYKKQRHKEHRESFVMKSMRAIC